MNQFMGNEHANFKTEKYPIDSKFLSSQIIYPGNSGQQNVVIIINFILNRCIWYTTGYMISCSTLNHMNIYLHLSKEIFLKVCQRFFVAPSDISWVICISNDRVISKVMKEIIKDWKDDIYKDNHLIWLLVIMIWLKYFLKNVNQCKLRHKISIINQWQKIFRAWRFVKNSSVISNSKTRQKNQSLDIDFSIEKAPLDSRI